MKTIGQHLDRLAIQLTRRLPGGPKIDTTTPAPIVSFSFDDVPDTALRNGARLLEAHDLRGTFYIAGGLAGTVEPDRRLLSAAGVAELQARGHELACHTFSHPNIRKLSRRALAAELDRNAAFLAAAGAVPQNFAFPYNNMSPFTLGEVRRRFRTARGGGEGINRGWIDPMLLQAIEIHQPEGYAGGLTRWIDDVAADPGWLVFYVHDVTETPTRFGCTPTTFERLVVHAVHKGCVVLPIDAALDRLGVPQVR